MQTIAWMGLAATVMWVMMVLGLLVFGYIRW